MDETLLQELRAATQPHEKAAWIAERILNGLPANFADVVRRCVILHWFNLPIVKALSKDTSIANNEVDTLYEQIASLPFIEQLPWGLAFHDLTREGLLQRYASTQPELLQHAASLAAPAYEALAHNEKMVAEAVFCYIIAGNQEAGERVLDRLLERACNRENWQYVDNLFYLQREAEQLPFAKPLPWSEQRQLLQDLVYVVQDFMQTYAIHTQEDILRRTVYTYVSQGIQLAYQNNFRKAIANYIKALQLAPNFAPAYASRGIVFERQKNYESALQDFTLALAVDPDNTFLLQKKGDALNELAQNEEALAVYEHLLHLDPQNAAGYVGKGNALISLEKHVEALVVYDQAIHLNSHFAAAYAGKGKALSRLKRYPEAHIAFEQAQQEDASAHIEEIEVAGTSKAKNPLQKGKSLREGATPPARRGKLPIAVVSPRPTLYRQNSLALRRERSLAFPVVAVLIILSALLFSVVRLNTTTGGDIGATVTAVAQANATATAGAPHSGNANSTAVAQANATAAAGVIQTAIAGQPIYNDPLNNANNPDTKNAAWDGLDGSNTFCSFQQDGYHISASSPITQPQPCLESNQKYQNAVITVDMVINSNVASGGLLFHVQNDTKGSSYFFEVSPILGVYKISLFNCDTCKQPLRGWTPSPSIIHHGQSMNTLQVIVNNNDFKFYMNGIFLTEIKDSTYTTGGLGFACYEKNQIGEAVFSNLKVYPYLPS